MGPNRMIEKLLPKLVLGFVLLCLVAFLTGCKTIKLSFPIPVAEWPNTFKLSKQDWDKKVVMVNVFVRGPNYIEPDPPELVIPGLSHTTDVLEGCKAENLGFFTSVWMVQATFGVPARDFTVTVGKVPDGFQQILPPPSENFSPTLGKEYFIMICMEPMEKSEIFLGKPFLAAETPLPLGGTVVQVEGTYIHEPSGMAFPESVGYFQRAQIRRYDQLGYNVSVGYDLKRLVSKIAFVTVYIHPAQPAKGLSSAGLLRNELKGVKNAIRTLHPRAKLLSEANVQLNQTGGVVQGMGVTFSYERLTLTGRQIVISKAYLFTHGDWFIKYRITYPKQYHSQIDTEIDQLMQALRWPEPTDN